MVLRKSFLLLAALLFSAPCYTQNPACAPPPGFRDTPHPAVAPESQLVSHTEELVVDQPLGAVLAAGEHTPLQQAIRRTSALPGVSGTYVLTSGAFGQPGSRRLVCLTDGSTTEEQVLERDQSQASAQYRYVVWNYTTEKARPIIYGVGHFEWTALGPTRTRVRWTYSFQLNRDRFPGCLGFLGDYLFRVWFLDRDYARMMRQTLGKD